MAKKFKVRYRGPGDPAQVWETVVSAADEPSAAQAIAQAGFEALDVRPVAASFLAAWLASISAQFTSRTYDPFSEIQFLKAFATAMRDGTQEADALRAAKLSFGRSNRKIRAMVADLAQGQREGGYGNLYELFSKREEFFSDELLTLLKTAAAVERNPMDFVSNPVPPDQKGSRMEGYVEVTESVLALKRDMFAKIVPPLAWFFGMMSAVVLILTLLIPNVLKAFSKLRDTSRDDYTVVGNATIAFSRFVTSYGLWILAALAAVAGVAGFFYWTSREFRFACHRAALKAPLVGDLIANFWTKKLTSLLALFTESGMRMTDSLRALAALAPLLPMKEELLRLSELVSTLDFEESFARYDEEERCFTEAFYVKLALDGRSGKFSRACAQIVKNCDDLWETDLRHYPVKIGKWIQFLGMGTVAFFVLGVMLIFVKTVFNSA